MITTESCSSNNIEPNTTTGILFTPSDLIFKNLNMTLTTSTTFTLVRNMSLSFLAPDISLYNTNYTKFCDALPKITANSSEWNYNYLYGFSDISKNIT